MTGNSLAFSFALLLGIGVAGAVRADVPPPEVEACQALQIGSPCNYNGPGTCQNAICTGIDYAHWDRDASAGPPAMTYDCVKCVPTGGGNDSGSDQTKDSSGCSVGGRLARTIGPWLAAGLFAAAMMLARRRPRR